MDQEEAQVLLLSVADPPILQTYLYKKLGSSASLGWCVRVL